MKELLKIQKKQQGFTLLESLLALFILSVGLLGVAGMHAQAMKTSFVAAQNTEIVIKGEELIDPDTGLSLGSEESKVGAIQVTDNSIGNGKASKCVIKSGSSFKQGDLVRQKEHNK